MIRWQPPTIRKILLLPCLLALAACGDSQQPADTPAEPAAVSGPTAPEDVAYENLMIPASLTGQPGDAQRGAEIMTTRKLGNCVACHKVSALSEAPFHGNVGPSLDGAGARWTEGQLRALVANPKTYFPQTVMPAYYRTEGLSRVRDDVAGQPILDAQQVEDVVAFLQTLQ